MRYVVKMSSAPPKRDVKFQRKKWSDEPHVLSQYVKVKLIRVLVRLGSKKVEKESK